MNDRKPDTSTTTDPVTTDPVTNDLVTNEDAFLAAIEAMVATWHGIAPPNAPGRRLAADLANTIRAYEALRGGMRFEDEPSGFDAALQAVREPGT